MPASDPASCGGDVTQVPLEQDPESQTPPHPPQLLTSDITFVQPPEHAVSPEGHPHAPPFETALQFSPATGQAPQATPPAPQDVLLCALASSHVEPLQQPEGHEAAVHWQTPETHCCMDPHGELQEPQFPLSVVSLTQTPGAVPQRAGVETGHLHAPALQLAAEGHARPQLPQLLLSELNIASQPLAGFPSQSA